MSIVVNLPEFLGTPGAGGKSYSFSAWTPFADMHPKNFQDADRH